jgi:predicted nucleotidyltransferase
MAVKPTRHADTKEVTYTTDHWAQLKKLRSRAVSVMATLEEFHLRSLVHGSIARGDIHVNSDIDVFIPEVQNSFLVETALEKAGLHANRRLIVQATPTYAMKAHIEIDEFTQVSFPLMKMRKIEREFYRFGGEANLEQLRADVRVLGVDKRLMLIEPTEAGHVESSVIGAEASVARVLGISLETVLDRVHALLRRDSIGRTGVFTKRELSPDETFEMALKKIADSNAAVRRRMKKRP